MIMEILSDNCIVYISELKTNELYQGQQLNDERYFSVILGTEVVIKQKLKEVHILSISKIFWTCMCGCTHSMRNSN